MATLQQKIRAEREFREMLRTADLPEPDEMEYGYTCIRAIWWEQKRAVVIDIDECAEDESDAELAWTEDGMRGRDGTDDEWEDVEDEAA